MTSLSDLGFFLAQGLIWIISLSPDPMRGAGSAGTLVRGPEIQEGARESLNGP